MGGSSGGSKSWGVVVAAALIVAAAPPAASAPEPAASAASVRFPIPLPAPVEALAARERASGSNLMFAQIVAAPHKGYHWSAVAYKARPSAGTFLALTFARTRAQGTQAQSSVFSWDLPRGALRMASDLRPASLATGKAMGSNGSISMKLSKRGRYARVPAGDGCTGTISVRIARFAGRFRFHARDEYFKRISFREAQVFLYREHDYSCPGEPPPPPGCPRFLSLTGTDAEAGVALGAFKTAEGRVDQTVVFAGKSGKADAVHTISATIAVPESFEASEDLTTASLDGDAAAPWLSGDLSYVGAPAVETDDERCGPYRSSSGFVTGDYTAHFDSIGPVTPATTGMAATLRSDI